MKRIKDIVELVFNVISAIILLPAFLWLWLILRGVWLLSGKEAHFTCFGQEPWPSEAELKNCDKFFGKSTVANEKKIQEKKNINISGVPLNHKQFRRFPAHRFYN